MRLLLLLINEAHAVTILSERSWCSGGGAGHTEKVDYSPSLISSDVANASVILGEQYGLKYFFNRHIATELLGKMHPVFISNFF